jgi:hypothetical protein
MAGQRTAGHRTGGQPDPGRRDRMGGHRMLDSGVVAVAWPLAVSTTATTPDRSIAAGRSSGPTPSGEQHQDRAAARTPRAPTLGRMGLVTAATGSCRWDAAVQLAPWRTALLGMTRVERRARREPSSVYAEVRHDWCCPSGLIEDAELRFSGQGCGSGQRSRRILAGDAPAHGRRPLQAWSRSSGVGGDLAAAVARGVAGVGTRCAARRTWPGWWSPRAGSPAREPERYSLTARMLVSATA